MTTHTTRMLIIGSGPAGLSAAIYGARAGLAPIVVQGLQPGGQLTITTDVENYPGFRDVIQGPWLMEEMQAQAEHVGTRMLWDTIVSVDMSVWPFRAVGDGGDIYEGETLVIATGAQAKWLGVPGEQELSGKGVSACATCDGFFYRGKKVVVIGGGNTAVEEALYMTNHSQDVGHRPPAEPFFFDRFSHGFVEVVRGTGGEQREATAIERGVVARELHRRAEPITSEHRRDRDAVFLTEHGQRRTLRRPAHRD